jgi:hypothetical protein
MVMASSRPPYSSAQGSVDSCNTNLMHTVLKDEQLLIDHVVKAALTLGFPHIVLATCAVPFSALFLSNVGQFGSF